MIDIGLVLDEVVTYLNTLTLSETFTAKKSFLPRDDIAELQDLTVIAFPRDYFAERSDRSTITNNFGIAIVITKKVSANLDEVNGLLTFVQEMYSQIFEHNFDTNKFTAEDSQMSPIYDYEKISQNSVFQSMITFNGRNFGTEA